MEKWNNLAAHITSQYAETYEQKEYLQAWNDEATGYYQRLYQALPESAVNRVKPLAPLTYFAENADAPAEVIFSGASCPPLISLPDLERGRATMIYGVSRAFLEQTPEMLAELTGIIRKRLPDQQEMVVGVLGDIVAKLVGLALLFKPEQLKDYLLNPVKPRQARPEVEIKPTVGLVMPSLGLAALQQFLRHFLGTEEPAYKKFEQRLEQINAELESLLSPYLDKPCEPMLNLKTASLREMRDAMLAAVNILLSPGTTLNALNGKSLFEVLIACAALTPQEGQELPAAWGQISATERQQCFDNLPDLLPAAQIVPLPFSVDPGLKMSSVPGFFDPVTIIAAILIIIGL